MIKQIDELQPSVRFGRSGARISWPYILLYKRDTNHVCGATGEGLLPGELDEGDAEQDALYDQAVQIVIESRRASISNIQRRLKIGYNRAARIVEAMEAAGVVGPMENSGSREVLVPEGA